MGGGILGWRGYWNIGKHIHADSIVYIGEKANNINEPALDEAQEFISEKSVYDLILTPDKVRWVK